MAKRKVDTHVLGVMVTGRAVHAALMETGTDGVKVLRRFMRQRTSRFSSSQTGMPELPAASDDDSDFSFSFTEGGSSVENMFLGSEFGGLEGVGGDEQKGQKGQLATFILELGDIIEECRDAGYDNPTLAFAIGASEIHQLELTLPGDKNGGEGKGKKKSTGRRSQLVELLSHQHSGSYKEECVAFLPMTPSEEGMDRFLAVFPKEVDPVEGTIKMLREQQGRTMPTVRMLDSEVPLYLGLSRAALSLGASSEEEESRNTLIVRAGAEDTLVMFLEGDTLQQSEILRSLTAYEAPETICSRVLLLQDEYGIADVQHVLLLSEEREDDLVESFEMFFPDARVESMRQYAPQLNDGTTGEVSAGALLPAVAVGLRMSKDERYMGVFEDVNLLPKQLLRRQIQLPVTWHVLALYILLFCTVLFFMASYFSTENQIAEHHRNIQEFQTEIGPIGTDAKSLQAHIDSLQAVHARYMRAINVLEGLLQGSDRWSRALESTSNEVRNVTGIWIESWSPRGGSIELSGNATNRDRVVELAERIEGSIATLTFSEIREWPVYSFKMSVPLTNELPQAAQYLREQVAQAERQAAENVPVTAASLEEKP